MKVFMINSVCGIRSTGRICTDIADVLKENGHDCRIAYGRENVPETYRDMAYRIGTDTDVRLHALRARLFDSSGFGSKRATGRLTEEIRAYDPDIIHLHNIHGYYLHLETLFRYLSDAGKPVVWTLHDCWAFTGHCSHFAEVGCDRWESGCFRCPLKRQYPSSFLFDRSRRNREIKKKLFTGLRDLTLVVSSDWLAGLVRRSFLKTFPVEVIPNGIDLSVFRPTAGNFREKYGLSDKKIILGAATAWGENKGLTEFKELSRLLGPDYQVVLVGLSPGQIKAMPPSILGLPATDNARELAAIYTAADVFVNAGHAETMGLTTVEAMACGTPVVASNLTAVPEFVTPESGRVVKELTAPCLRDSIQEVLAHSFEPMKNAAEYEKKRQYLKYLALYSKITNR